MVWKLLEESLSDTYPLAYRLQDSSSLFWERRWRERRALSPRSVVWKKGRGEDQPPLVPFFGYASAQLLEGREIEKGRKGKSFFGVFFAEG